MTNLLRRDLLIERHRSISFNHNLHACIILIDKLINLLWVALILWVAAKTFIIGCSLRNKHHHGRTVQSENAFGKLRVSTESEWSGNHSNNCSSSSVWFHHKTWCSGKFEQVRKPNQIEQVLFGVYMSMWYTIKSPSALC